MTQMTERSRKGKIVKMVEMFQGRSDDEVRQRGHFRAVKLFCLTRYRQMHVLHLQSLQNGQLQMQTLMETMGLGRRG